MVQFHFTPAYHTPADNRLHPGAAAAMPLTLYNAHTHGRSYILREGQLLRVPARRADVFTSRALGPADKGRLMKFLSAALEAAGGVGRLQVGGWEGRWMVWWMHRLLVGSAGQWSAALQVCENQGVQRVMMEFLASSLAAGHTAPCKPIGIIVKTPGFNHKQLNNLTDMLHWRADVGAAAGPV
jgi:hypothetical protein